MFIIVCDPTCRDYIHSPIPSLLSLCNRYGNAITFLEGNDTQFSRHYWARLCVHTWGRQLWRIIHEAIVPRKPPILVLKFQLLKHNGNNETSFHSGHFLEKNAKHGGLTKATCKSKWTQRAMKVNCESCSQIRNRKACLIKWGSFELVSKPTSCCSRGRDIMPPKLPSRFLKLKFLSTRDQFIISHFLLLHIISIVTPYMNAPKFMRWKVFYFEREQMHSSKTENNKAKQHISVNMREI